MTSPHRSSTQPPTLQLPIKIGICGLGRAGWNMVFREVENREDFIVSAGYDHDSDRARELNEACGAFPCSSLNEMLEREDVDVVVIATRSLDHATMAAAVLQAGKHVVVEKPLALDLAATDRLIKEAGQSKGSLLVRHNRRFDKTFQLARRILAEGRLGQLLRVELRQMNFAFRSDWQTILRLGGGQLLNWGPHVVDWGVQLGGRPKNGIVARLAKRIAAGDAEDHVKILYETNQGVWVDIEICGACALKQPGWSLSGTRGSLVVDQKEALLKFIPEHLDFSPELNEGNPTREKGSYQGLDIPWIEETLEVGKEPVLDFWDCVRDDLLGVAPFPVTLEEARETMRILHEARQGTPFAIVDPLTLS